MAMYTLDFIEISFIRFFCPNQNRIITVGQIFNMKLFPVAYTVKKYTWNYYQHCSNNYYYKNADILRAVLLKFSL